MTEVRREYWIPRLRRLTKRVIKRCNGCKRFHATAFAQPPTGNLPRDRTEGSSPFQVVGVDYAGPILVRTRKDREKKSYILLYACSLSRALHLELLPDLTAQRSLSKASNALLPDMVDPRKSIPITPRRSLRRQSGYERPRKMSNSTTGWPNTRLYGSLIYLAPLGGEASLKEWSD